MMRSLTVAVLLAVPLVRADIETDKETLAKAKRLHDQAQQALQKGETAKALPLGQQSLAIRRKQLGAKHLDTAESLVLLARVYRSIGRFAEALALAQEGLAIRKDALGEKH